MDETDRPEQWWFITLPGQVYPCAAARDVGTAKALARLLDRNARLIVGNVEYGALSVGAQTEKP